MTSTKGHFDRNDIYEKTINDLDSHFSLSDFEQKFASIKISSGQMDHFQWMKQFLLNKDFDISAVNADWKHGEDSHQHEYIKDISRMVSLPELQKVPYTLFMEDDWLLRSQKSESKIWDWFLEAIFLLERNPNIVQVRFPRFNNEFDRINRLYAKHGIPARATRPANEKYFTANDWSNNPFIARSRDLYTAMMLMAKNPTSFPKHAEHGFGRAMRYLSYENECLAVMDPSNIRAYHIGTKVGEEDKINETLNSD